VNKWMKQSVLAVGIILAGLLIGEAQITLPYTFTTTVPVAQLNQNLSTLASGALLRTGGTLTGNLTVNPSVTIDGVDISAALGGSGTGAFGNVTTSNTGATSIDAAGGITAGTGNVAIVDTSGRIPALSSTYVASLSGANLTAINPLQVIPTWSTFTYAAGNFTGSGTLTWTVSDLDENVRYMRLGTTMVVLMDIVTTTVSGTGYALKVDIPGGLSATGGGGGACSVADNGTEKSGIWIISGGDSIDIYSGALGANLWTAATDNTYVRCMAIFQTTT